MLVRHVEAWLSRIYGWTVVTNGTDNKGADASASKLTSRSIEQPTEYSTKNDKTVH